MVDAVVVTIPGPITTIDVTSPGSIASVEVTVPGAITEVEVQVPGPITSVEVQVPTGPAVAEVRVPGVQGPAGAAGNEALSRTALEAISALRALAFAAGGVRLADPSSAASLAALAGVSITAAGSGQSVTLRSSGEVSDTSWSWTAGAAIFVGASGALTQSVPAGPIRRIGTALTATTIVVDFGPLILRS